MSRCRVAATVVAALVVLEMGAAESTPRASRADSVKAKQTVRLSLRGGSAQRIEVCGRRRSVTIAPERAMVVAAIRFADRRNLRGGRHARLIVERCENGRWRRLRSERFGTLGRYRRVRRYRLGIDTSTPGDYRVRVRVAGDRRRRPARTRRSYLRVGVGEIVDTAIRFTVWNVNRSQLACPTDGRPYAIVGHLTAPRAALEVERPAVTLWVHGGETGGAYLRLPVRGYDMTYELARLGHASVVFDRLGQGASDAPPGDGSCIGGQADIAHQLVEALRAGRYAVPTAERPIAFARVALAGHSFGGPIAEYEAGSFEDVDALLVMDASFSNPGSALLTSIVAGESLSCPVGGHPRRSGGPPHYAYVWPNDERYKSDVFYDAEPAVMDALAGRRERNPCGDLESVPAAIIGERAVTARVRVPVLVLFADHDAVFPPPAGERQRQLFTGSPDVTLVTIVGAGHAVMLERQAPVFRAAVSRWLRARGF